VPGFHPLGFTLVMAGWIFSLCLHEFAHALVAYRGGDTSVREKGYLTFNPLRYTHPVYSLVWPLVFLLMGGIGLPGGAVYINRHLLRSRGWDCGVSLAGPAANAVLLVFLMAPFWLGLAPERDAGLLWEVQAFLCLLQLSAILFNLLPIPPLDGFGAASAYMDAFQRARIESMGHLFFIGMLIAMTRTPLGEFFWRAVYGFALLIGIPLELAEAGERMARMF
jgi:Zn-dependent protease